MVLGLVKRKPSKLRGALLSKVWSGGDMNASTGGKKKEESFEKNRPKEAHPPQFGRKELAQKKNSCGSKFL